MSFFTRWQSIGQAATRSAVAVNELQTDMSRAGTYALLGSLYASELTSLSVPGLDVLPVYNPTRRVVDWYAGRCYSDVWTDDGLPLPDGTPSTVPFTADTDERVRQAAMAALSWSNWHRLRYVYVRHGGTFGDVFLKPTLDIDAGKVYVKVFEPKYVTDLTFNQRGDVIGFMIEFPVVGDDHNRTRYQYGERWDKETITTYRNGTPASYHGQPAEQPNPFGFVPAVWVNHRHIGGVHGAPAVDGVIPKIQELNMIVDSAHRFIERLNRQPIWIASAGKFGDAVGGVTVVDTEAGERQRRYSVGTIKGPADMRVGSMLQDMGLGPGLAYIQSLLAEIEKDLPETTVDEQLRNMTQVTGPGAARIMGDVAFRLYEAESNYDAGLIDAAQMMISMGAFAVRSGLWGPSGKLTEAQRLFGAFDLSSYDKGDLAISFHQRPLITETAMERVGEALARESVKTPQGLREVGYDDTQIYGDGNVPGVIPGLLEERQGQTVTAGSLFGNLLNAGAV